ncbi:MAG: hypothetical protein E7373_03135 [Clostridiales bacterium]|nr:hypothetical protein [Clostridiales bacterium]
MEYKLNFELVPDGCWYSNLRSILSKAQWEFIRNDARERAGGRCMVCGKKSNSLEAHERWSYDEKNGIQKLEDVVAVCKDCHSVMHIGHTQLKKGNIEKYENHFMKVNNCTYAEYCKALSDANAEHRRRNLVSDWKINLNYLRRYIGDQLL